MKVFLTGATGFVGSHLAELMINNGHQVRALLRTTSNLRWIADLNLETFYAKLDDANALLKGLQDVDVVIHAAALTKALKNEDYYQRSKYFYLNEYKNANKSSRSFQLEK